MSWYQVVLHPIFAAPCAMRLTAGACSFLVIPWSGGLGLVRAEGGRTSLVVPTVIGPRSTWVDLRWEGGDEFLICAFELGATRRLFGPAAGACGLDAVEPLIAIAPRDSERTFEALARASEPVRPKGLAASAEMAAGLTVNRLDRSLAELLASAAPVPESRLLRGLYALYGEEHPTRIAAAAEHLGICPGRLGKATRELLGVPPKEFLCISRAKRFLDAVVAARPEEGPRLTDKAMGFDYYDQAHAIHDIVRRTGMTPGTIARRVVPLDGEAKWYHRKGIGRR